MALASLPTKGKWKLGQRFPKDPLPIFTDLHGGGPGYQSLNVELVSGVQPKMSHSSVVAWSGGGFINCSGEPGSQRR